MEHSKLHLDIKINKLPTFSSDNKNNNEIFKNNEMLMFERLLNNKNKFKLNNHLSEIDIDDGDFSTETLERNKSRTDLLIPNGAPNQYTFGQK